MRPALCALIVVLVSSPAHAEQCRPIEGGSAELAAADTQVRLEFVHQVLMDDSHRTRTWWVGWVSFLSLADAVQLSAVVVGYKVPVPPHNGFPHFVFNSLYSARGPLIVGTVATSAALIGVAATPPRIMSYGPAFDLQLTSDSLTDRCVLLANGERMLMQAARDELAAHGWLPHVLNAAVNLAASLVVGIAFNQWISAAIGLVLGEGVGEILIYTQPSISEKALANYRAGDFAAVSASRVSVESQGMSLTLRF